MASMNVMLALVLIGWRLGQIYGYSEYERQMRAKVLNELLKTPPEERSKRVLDLCFFVLADKKTTQSLLQDDVLPEVYEHLEKEMRRNVVEGGKFCDFLPLNPFIRYEHLVPRVQKRIEEYRKREQDMNELEGRISKNTSESRKAVEESIDLEKGVEMRALRFNLR
ncbi:hypothetical protein BCON_0457g00010 [Botryotinia convoluta]|uniref:Uncharacterized protein n=1 Tax=Botryotinia convoluta TaxID=54673 RepID=A0A4Z1H7N3_9HELO|nr:hypothetical protein BCON_0457g00010 [Botryotinia convoluta]